ncbi:MAG: endonuclease [Planctomycetia bacterium]|nr:endonuclease [Planctomycetia bacterium]
MPATMSKQQVLTQLLDAVESAPQPAIALPVLEQFLYGICREDSTPEMAKQAYENLRKDFFDWNEVRVSTVREIEDALGGLSDASTRAERVIAFLQEVFETTFSFDLEAIQKKGLKQASKTLQGLKAANEYVVGWVIQRSLGGHAIPIDTATLRCARRLGLIDTDDIETARASLEHQVPKAKGAAFTDTISILAEQSCWEDEPHCTTCPLKGGCPSARLDVPSSSRSKAKPR